MKIHLINPYGPIPIAGESWRDYRFTIIGNYLSSQGHEVVWYTSSFSHHFKKQRSADWEDILVNPKFIIRLVPTPGYKKNISIGRILRDWIFAFKVYNEGKKNMTKPNLIIYSESPLCFGFSGFRLAKFLKIPVIYDQMDLWPELMINSFPKRIKWFINFLFYPVFISRKTIYRKLDGFISLASPYLSIPLNIVPSLKDKPNDIIYNGIDVVEFRKETLLNKDLLKILPKKENADLWFVFAGTLGPSYDILNLLDVGRLLIKENVTNVRIIIAGDGPLKMEVNNFILENKGKIVSYLGHIAPQSLIDLYKNCDVGLSTYTEISNVEMPDKFYDYTAAGLPIINSLKGEVGKIIEKEGVGLNYKAGDTKELYDAFILLISDLSLKNDLANKSFDIGLKYDKNNQIGKLGILIDKLSCKYD